jgi:hypothetical protein
MDCKNFNLCHNKLNMFEDICDDCNYFFGKWRQNVVNHVLNSRIDVCDICKVYDECLIDYKFNSYKCVECMKHAYYPNLCKNDSVTTSLGII